MKMKKIVFLIMIILFAFDSYGQTANEQFDRGMEKWRILDYKGALIYFSKTIELDPNRALAYTFRGNCKFNLGDHRGSIADFTKAISLFSPNEKDLLAEAYYNRGTNKGMLNDCSGAIADFTKAISYNPKLGKAYQNRGLCKLQSNQKDEGCLDLSKAGELGVKEVYDIIRNYCN